MNRIRQLFAIGLLATVTVTGVALLANIPQRSQTMTWPASLNPEPGAAALVANIRPAPAATPCPNPFQNGQGTWYVATKFRCVTWGGNANTWLSNASQQGYPEGRDPKVGAIVVTFEDKPQLRMSGHVAFVESVSPDGKLFTVSEMNYERFGVVNRRSILSANSAVKGFIYERPASAPAPLASPCPNPFTKGQGTWYVATKFRCVTWRGNANAWLTNAKQQGYPEGSNPKVGAILVTTEGQFGNVAYVEEVTGNSFKVSEMNATCGWNCVDTRTIQLGDRRTAGFIYPKHA